jgi:hypothetical protein
MARFFPSQRLHQRRKRYRDGSRKKPELEFSIRKPALEKIEGAPASIRNPEQGPETGDYTRLIYSQTDLTDALLSYDEPKGKRLEHDIWEEVFISGAHRRRLFGKDLHRRILRLPARNEARPAFPSQRLRQSRVPYRDPK